MQVFLMVAMENIDFVLKKRQLQQSLLLWLVLDF